MAIYALLIAGQSNVGSHPVSTLPVYMQGAVYGQTYIWNGGPYWGVLQPGVNTGLPNSPGTWGLETAIAYNFRKEHPDDVLLIVKSAKGETGLAGNPLALDWSPDSSGEMFDLTTESLNAARAALVGIEMAAPVVVWTQGETDALADRTGAQYTADMINLRASASSEWGASEWIINGVRADLGGTSGEIAGAQRTQGIYVCTHSLQTLDGVHYTPDSTLALGAADVSAWLTV